MGSVFPIEKGVSYPQVSWLVARLLMTKYCLLSEFPTKFHTSFSPYSFCSPLSELFGTAKSRSPPLMAASYPLYSTVDLITGLSDAALTIMYRGLRFHIQVFSNCLSDLKSNSPQSSLQEKFQHFLNNLDEEPQIMDELEEWMG